MKRAHLPKVMIAMAQIRAVEDVLRTIVEGIAECDRVVLARIWLKAPGDICGGCRFRPECPDQSLCLHLVASAGNATNPAADHRRLDGAFRRFPLGVRKIGRVGGTGESLWLTKVSGGEPWVAEPKWMARERVATFAAQPLVFRGDVLGVLAIFDRGTLDPEDFEWLRIVADHAAVSIANARAFEEIESLKGRLEQENLYLRQEVTEALGVGDLIGVSAGLNKVAQQIRLVAPTDTAVLVTGESGTGKEVVGRAIHEASPRRSGPFIKVNCGAIADTLFESEFFGHAKGAFTGALKDRPGRFELADGGTLLLDEIGEVPPPMQAKLLRVLQEREVERVGEAKPRRLDVRIVASTNRDLAREVAAGRFRQDLYYRLSVFPLEIPPLRQRRDDILPLAQHFAGVIARRLGRPTPRISQAARATLEAYDWPGNVRELQNAVERAMILSTGTGLRFDLGPKGLSAAGSKAAPPTVGSAATPSLWTRAELKRKEKESIALALKQARGRVFGPGGAASLLGMKPTTLASRIRALGIATRKEE